MRERIPFAASMILGLGVLAALPAGYGFYRHGRTRRTPKAHGKHRFVSGLFLGLVLLGLPATLAAAQPPAHGMWVYDIVANGNGLLDQDPEARDLLKFSSQNHISEVYLALGPQAAALQDDRLPHFIGNLRGAELRVEALISCRPDVSPLCQDLTWEQRIDAVGQYNNGVDASAQFDGIHLDLEPWIKTGSDLSWADDLIGYYTDASSTAASYGLTTTGDISGDKVVLLDPLKQQNLLSAATRLVLMEYNDDDHPNPNWTVANINEKVMDFLDAVQDTLPSSLFMIAARVTDFGQTANNPSRVCQNGNVLNQFDAPDGYGSTVGYDGWATFKYATYSDANVCPANGCCAIGP